MLKWNVVFYQRHTGDEPVRDFLLDLPPKHQAKAIWEIDLLAKHGTGLKEPYAKAIAGERYSGLWELRVQYANQISRVFYFMCSGNTFVLLHGFLKKTDHTPKKELERALKYMLDYLGRVEE